MIREVWSRVPKKQWALVKDSKRKPSVYSCLHGEDGWGPGQSEIVLDFVSHGRGGGLDDLWGLFQALLWDIATFIRLHLLVAALNVTCSALDRTLHPEVLVSWYSLKFTGRERIIIFCLQIRKYKEEQWLCKVTLACQWKVGDCMAASGKNSYTWNTRKLR